MVYYDELIQPLTLNKLLYGRNINTEVLHNNNEEPAQDITKRYIFIKKLLKHFKTRWTNEYLKELLEHHYNRKTKYSLHPNVEDVVLLHDDTLKQYDWKIGNTVELIISNDKSVRPTKFHLISNDRIITSKRPINKLLPVEFSNQYTIEPTFINEKNVPQVVVRGSVPQE